MPLHRRLPQRRGFSNVRFKTTYQVVNTGRLAELYPEGGDVTPDDLAARGAVRAGETGQGPRHRRSDHGTSGDGARLLRVRQGEDHRGRRYRYHTVS